MLSYNGDMSSPSLMNKEFDALHKFKYDNGNRMKCFLNIELFLERPFVYMSGLPMVPHWFV